MKRDERLAKWAIPGFFGSLAAAVFGFFRASFLVAAPMIHVTLAPQSNGAPSLQGGTLEIVNVVNAKDPRKGSFVFYFNVKS